MMMSGFGLIYLGFVRSVPVWSQRLMGEPLQKRRRVGQDSRCHRGGEGGGRWCIPECRGGFRYPGPGHKAQWNRQLERFTGILSW